MKKLVILVIIIALISISLCAGCNKTKDTNVIRLNEVTHSVFYAPLYIAINE